MSKKVRISDETYEKLSSLEEKMQSSKQDIIKDALEKLAREIFFKEVNEQYEQLKKDPKAWQEMLEERKLWESIDNKL